MIVALAVLMAVQFLNAVANLSGGVPSVGRGRYLDAVASADTRAGPTGSSVLDVTTAPFDVECRDHGPRVSLLVPARDEAAIIEQCVRALLAQRLTSFEVVVMDDQSTDGTAAIVARIAIEDPRVRLCDSSEPPEGWTGKNFACQQLADRAQGEWLVFVDADVTLVPDAVAESIAIADRRGYDFVSGLPFAGGGTRAAWWMTSAMSSFVLCAAPIWLLNGRAKRLAGLAMGQFMCFRREAYTAMGGHAAVRDSLVEDVSIALEMARIRRPTGYLDMTHAMDADLFPTFAAAGGGISRWFRSLSSISAWGITAAALGGLSLYLLPWVVLGFGLRDFVAGSGGGGLVAVGALGVASVAMVDRVTRRPAWMTPLQPLALCCWFGCFLVGLTRSLRRAPTRWRGREYAVPTGTPR